MGHMDYISGGGNKNGCWIQFEETCSVSQATMTSTPS